MLKEQLAAQLRANEKAHELFTIGARFGHFLVRAEDLSAVPFDGEDGVESLLEYMVRNDWEGIYEGDSLIGVRKYPSVVMVQAGGQLELQVAKTASLKVIDKAYLDFLKGLFDELDSRKQVLLAVGYQPVTKAEDISLAPLALAEMQARYLQDNPQALQLLKGAARITVSVDYAHSDDFEKKMRIAELLSPVFSALFDNVAMWGGETYQGFCGNRRLMNGNDPALSQRGRVISDRSYKYNEYAQFAANAPAIAVAEGEDGLRYVGGQTAASLYDGQEAAPEVLQAVLNMADSDLRVTEEGIQLRMMDSLPYPLNMACLALIKGLFYNADHLNALLDLLKDITQKDVDKAKAEIVEKGMEAKLGPGTVRDLAKDLFFMVSPTLEPVEQHYIQPLDTVIFKLTAPKDVTARQLDSMRKN